MKLLIHSQTLTVKPWSLSMEKQFHPTLDDECKYLPMVRLKLIHVSKRTPSLIIVNSQLLSVMHNTIMHASWQLHVGKLNVSFFIWKSLLQSGAVIMPSIITWYSMQHYNDLGIPKPVCTHKMHPISHPHGQAMGCLLWKFSKTIDRIIMALHCIML